MTNEHQIPNWEKELRGDFNAKFSPASQHESISKTMEIVYNFLISKFASYHAHLKERVMDMQCDERKVANFGNWQAITYEEKQLVNAVLSEVISLLE